VNWFCNNLQERENDQTQRESYKTTRIVGLSSGLENPPHEAAAPVPRSALLGLAALQRLGQDRGSLNREFCGFPRGNAAGDLTDRVEPAALQQTRGDG
jgi:hypothetical protein